MKRRTGRAPRKRKLIPGDRVKQVDNKEQCYGKVGEVLSVGKERDKAVVKFDNEPRWKLIPLASLRFVRKSGDE